MVKKFILIFSVVLLFCETFAQTKVECDSFQIIGIYHIDDLCLFTNHQMRIKYYALLNIKRNMHYRFFCMSERKIDSIKLNDKTITKLLKQCKAFVCITECYPLLKDIVRCSLDTTLIQNIENTYTIHSSLNPKEKIELFSDSVYCYSNRYEYIKFNTNRFLFISMNYSFFYDKKPLVSYGSKKMVDFWLKPEKEGETVVVVVPLASDNFQKIRTDS